MTFPNADAQKIAVQKDVDEVVAAAQRFLHGSGNATSDEAKVDLQKKASNLVQTIRGPIPAALSSMEDVSQDLPFTCPASFKRASNDHERVFYRL